MTQSKQPYPIIGMSPGNSYFKDREVRFLLEKTVKEFGKTAILVADIPAISTYIALGYPENRARNKAVPKGNNLKNRTRRMQQTLGFSDDQVRIVEWGKEILPNTEYGVIYERVQSLYNTNKDFQAAVDATTRSVLESSDKTIPNIEQATKTGIHYLLSELAFLEFAPSFLQSEKVIYIYHKNWSVYEDYISGKFDGQPKLHLDFRLSETPDETFRPLQEEQNKEINVLSSIRSSNILRAAYFPYPPCFMVDPQTKAFSGIFFDVLTQIAELYQWKITWSEEVGYGVIVDGLNEHRFDIFGSTVWPTPERIEQASFSIPLFYSNVDTWVRSDMLEKWSKKDMHNDAYFRIAIKEDDISDSIAQKDFPNARYVRVPQLSPVTALLDFVAEEKADATFVEPYLAQNYMANNHHSLATIPTYSPIRTFPNTFMMRKGESDLQALMNTALQSMIDKGTIRQLIKKYTGSETTFEFTSRDNS